MIKKLLSRDYWIIKHSGLFDAEYYLRTYPDVRQTDIDPVWHYCKHGWREGRNPSVQFDTNFYLNTYSDVKEAGVNPLVHYVGYGKKEGRNCNGNIIKIESKESYFARRKKTIWKIATLIKKDPKFLLNIVFDIKKAGFAYAKQNIQAKMHIEFVLANATTGQYAYFEPYLSSAIKKEMKAWHRKPLISIIMPVYNVDPKWLDLAIKSVEGQWYENWELCIADDASTNEATIKYLKSIKNKKIKIKYLKQNLNISGASNEALDMASGEYIALMDNDDEITPDALYEVTKAINETNAEFIYSDEDKIEINGSFGEVHFKPDYSPQMILSQNYISHLAVIKKVLIEKAGGFTVGLEGAQDYDLYLKVLDFKPSIKHIKKVLYHWRKIPGSTAAEFSGKSYAHDAGLKSIENTLFRRGLQARVLDGKYPGTYRVKYEIEGEPLVSIVIPFRDKPELLRMCIESILSKSAYVNYEILGINNGSVQEDTFMEIKRLSAIDKRVKFYDYDKPFNFSAINNYAVYELAKGSQVVLLNNDIEIITSEWIECMLEFSQMDGIGVVGAKLYYPNEIIQHAGVIIGVGGVAGHSHKYFDRYHHGYFSRLHLIQNLSAVTAACCMVKKTVYEKLGGLDEVNLKIAFNDVDFCLRAVEAGYLNVFTPYCEAYHHESISRGHEDTPDKIKRFNSEINYMKDRHANILSNGDSYYNPNLTLDKEDFSLE